MLGRWKTQLPGTSRPPWRPIVSLWLIWRGSSCTRIPRPLPTSPPSINTKSFSGCSTRLFSPPKESIAAHTISVTWNCYRMRR
ncbi:hypothetical protein K438DRAFT_1857268 [Mycena galopus ATCC 62051]|nr:hypothetical protein K438DRAFT_1857268 [Mycena galopus ATCC 62051]